MDTAQHEQLARRMIELLVASDHPDDSHARGFIDSAMASTQVLIHEPATWTVGGQQPVDPRTRSATWSGSAPPPSGART